MSVCRNHPDSTAKNLCMKCGAALCVLCVFGTRAEETYCRPCWATEPARGRKSPIVTILLFIMSIPVAAPGLLILYLNAKRWGRVPMWLYFPSMILGGFACHIFMQVAFAASIEVAWGLIAVSFVASLVFYIREAAYASK